MATMTNLYIADVQDYLTHMIGELSTELTNHQNALESKKKSFMWPIKNLIFKIEKSAMYEIRWIGITRENYHKTLNALLYHTKILDDEWASGDHRRNRKLVTVESLDARFPIADFYEWMQK